MFIECNVINNRKRYICLYQNDSLKNYFVSAVPMSLPEDRADQLIDYINSRRNKLTGAELRRFNKAIAYLNKIKEV